MNGFHPSEVQAIKIMAVPKHVERAYKRTEKYKEHPWPWYVYGKTFFEKLGAEFRNVEGQKEMLLDEVVYEVEEFVPCSIRRSRMIGKKAMEALRSDPDITREYHEEDIWDGPVIHLVTGIGACLIRCQQIENYIYNSFLLGVSKKQKKKYETIDDMRRGWKRKTLGNMLQSIEEAWEIHPVVKAGFQMFLQQRNILVHGIATDDRYNIQTHWGRQELANFLDLFDVTSLIVKRAFRASYYASIEFGVKNWGLPPGMPKRYLSKKQRDEMAIFAEFFTPKLDAI